MIPVMKVLILLAVVTMIVCQASETSSARRDRYSFQETSESSADNVHGYREPRTNEHRSKKSETSIFERIQKTFVTDPNATGIQIFNNLGTPFAATSDSFKRNDVIIFPDQKIPTYPTSGAKLDCIDAENIEKGYCTNVNNYPDIGRYEDYLKKKFGSFFVKDDLIPQNFSQRMNTEPNEEFLCTSQEKVIYPKKAQTAQLDWKYIVQDEDKDLRQGVLVDTCIFEGKDTTKNPPCRYMEGLPIGKRAYCKQNFMLRTLISPGENNTFVRVSFRLPSCCKCVILST